jgi:hypothetical protein
MENAFIRQTLHRSAGDTVSSIEDDIVALEGDGPSQQEGEAKGEARR